MSYKYALITFLGLLIILGLASSQTKYQEGLTGALGAEAPPSVGAPAPGGPPPPPSVGAPAPGGPPAPPSVGAPAPPPPKKTPSPAGAGSPSGNVPIINIVAGDNNSATPTSGSDGGGAPPAPGNRPYEFDPKVAEEAAKSWRNSQDKKWAARRADAKKKALVKYNLDEDKLDDQRKASSEARQAKKQAEFAFIAERQAKDKARIKKSEPPSSSAPAPKFNASDPVLPGVNMGSKRNSCEFFNCGDGYQAKSGSVTEEQVRAAVDAATNAEAAVAMYKKNADLAAAAALVGPSCTKIWAEEAAALYAAAVKKSAQTKIAVETIKKKAVFPTFCAGGECTKDECCEIIPGGEKCKPGCGCSKCIGIVERGAVHAPDNTRVDTTTGPFVRNFFEGTEIFITPEGEPHAQPSGRNGRRRERRHYSDYHQSYKKTVHHYPQESIRFDLLTPVPYSDAMAAPMGPGAHQNPHLPKPALEQLSFRDRQINNID